MILSAFIIMWVQEVILKMKTNVIINKLDILYSTPTHIFSFVFIQLRRTNVLFSWDHALIKKKNYQSKSNSFNRPKMKNSLQFIRPLRTPPSNVF